MSPKLLAFISAATGSPELLQIGGLRPAAKLEWANRLEVFERLLDAAGFVIIGKPELIES